MFRILAVGDVVGGAGKEVVLDLVPKLREERELDFVIVNAENAAGGSGINERQYREIRRAGVDVVTMGDHAFGRRESLPLYEKQDRLLRPANWPTAAPGRGACVVEGPRGVRVGVIHLQGRIFMSNAGDFFETVDRHLEAMKPATDVVVVDMHAEATSEKIALSWYLDGRVSFLFGTHTHVPTADAVVRPKGTAYVTDLGMTGPYDGVIGRLRSAVIKKMRTNVHERFLVAEGDERLGAAIVDVDERTGMATSIETLWLPHRSGSES